MNIFDAKIAAHHSFNDFSVICCVIVLVWEKELHCERTGIFWRLHKNSCWTDGQHHFCLQNWRGVVNTFINKSPTPHIQIYIIMGIGSLGNHKSIFGIIIWYMYSYLYTLNTDLLHVLYGLLSEHHIP